MSDSMDPKAAGQMPIAVVGVSALFPGSLDKTGFWRDILAGSDLIKDVPASHWLIEDYYDPDPKAPDMTYASRGAFLEDIDFDALSFGIPPTIAPATDTAQLLALIVANRVLQEATGGQFNDVDKEKVSVILGVTSAQELLGSMVSRLQKPIWVEGLRQAGIPEDEVQRACAKISEQFVPWQESTFPGLLGNVVAGRIANRLDLHGTNCVTDAACASAFSAVSMGVNELRLGQSDLVLTGGVDTMNDIFMYMCFSKTPALSRTGDCRPFSEKGDGTMLGEGIGMVALKRLADAERDGDNIYAVLKGVGSSSDGRSKSVYAPVPEGQARSLVRAYENAGYNADTVELVEAHGTGTVAGDAAEFQGLVQAFDDVGREDRQWCALGSVKSQIGHTKAAAGSAGLFKVVMALHNKVIPPTIKVDVPNPKMDLPASPFYLSGEARPWVRGSSHPRRASVSSFGFGGSNFHLTLEEYTGEHLAPRVRVTATELVLLSAASPAALIGAAKALAGEARADKRGEESGRGRLLPFLAWNTQRDFDASAPARLAVVAKDGAELAEKLIKAADAVSKSPDAAFSWPAGTSYSHGPAAGPVAFLFPGQGSQYLSMGSGVASTFDQAIGAWDQAADAQMGDVPLQEVVFPRRDFSAGAAEAQTERLTATQWAQPAIGVASLALLRVVDAIGVKPVAVAGHSFGEVTALHAAGVLSADDMLKVARRRGELMAEAAELPGSMVAVSATIEQLQPLLDEWKLDVVVANHNHPKQVVLSGTTDAVAAAEAKLKAAGLKGQRLKVATAFHSPVVSASTGPFAEFLADVDFGEASLPVYANSEAAPYPADAAGKRALLSGQIARPVRFVEQIDAMYAAGARVFLEVGPNSVLTGLVGRCLGDRPHTAINLDRKGRDGVTALWTALARLAAAGVAFDTSPLWEAWTPVEDPRTRPAPKMTITINGANYDKPYPPSGGASKRAAPNPPRVPEQVVVEKIVEKIVHVPVASPAAAPAAAPVAQPAAYAQPAQQTLQHAAPTYAPQAAPSGAWLNTFQELQRQTAEAFTAYERTMAETHMAFLSQAERTTQALTTMVTGQPIAAPQQYAAPQYAAPAPHYAPAPVAAPAPQYAAPAPQYAAPVVQQVAQPVAPAPVIPAPAPVVKAPVVIAAPVVAAAPSLDLHGLLMSVVAEKTGYPPEMLSDEMSLEADLGIDSIKRVEILSAMREEAPELPEVDASHMAQLQTLGQIVEYMAQNGGGEDPPAKGADAVPESGTVAIPSNLGRFALREVEAPALGMATAGLSTYGTLYITGGAVAAPLAAALTAAGVPAVSTDSLPADARAVVYVGGLREFADTDAALAVNREAFRLARQLAPNVNGDVSGDSAGGLFVTVQSTGGDFGLSGAEGEAAWSAGLSGLVKTAAQEWPAAQVKAVDVERGDRSDSAIAVLIASELMGGGPEIEVGLRADGRRTSFHSERVLANATGAVPLDASSVVVASGGARGVTAATLIALSRETRASFVLLGRTPLADEPSAVAGIDGDANLKRALLTAAKAAGTMPTPAALGGQVRGILAGREIRATLAAMAAAGSKARYVSVDVTDRAGLSAMLDTVRSEWGPISAVVHGAGVLADKLIAEKTDAQFDKVFDTKIEGLRALLAATASDPLKVICLFSSVAARSGNQGQCDYAMANEILNKVAGAEAARRPDCRVKSLGWGPWEGGMVTPALKARFEQLGVPLIPLDVGARMLVEDLKDPAEVELVLGGAPQKGALAAAGREPAVNLEVRVSRDSHPYLADHSIKGNPVVPVVLVLEWFVRAARACRSDLHLVAIRDLKVLRGVTLEDFDAVTTLSVRCRQISNGDGAQLSLELRRGDHPAPFYSASAEMSERPARTPKSVTSPKGLQAWDAAIYGDVLFHGPEFQVIRGLDGVSSEGMVATMSGTGDQGWTDDWRTDVAAMDGGLQLALLWAQKTLGGSSLPTGFSAFYPYQDGAMIGPLRCVLKRRSITGSKAVTDLVLEDAQGVPFAELRGVTTHLLPSASTETKAQPRA